MIQAKFWQWDFQRKFQKTTENLLSFLLKTVKMTESFPVNLNFSVKISENNRIFVGGNWSILLKNVKRTEKCMLDLIFSVEISKNSRKSAGTKIYR